MLRFVVKRHLQQMNAPTTTPRPFPAIPECPSLPAIPSCPEFPECPEDNSSWSCYTKWQTIFVTMFITLLITCTLSYTFFIKVAKTKLVKLLMRFLGPRQRFMPRDTEAGNAYDDLPALPPPPPAPPAHYLSTNDLPMILNRRNSPTRSRRSVLADSPPPRRATASRIPTISEAAAL